jgi:hypothetical protein
MNVSVSNVFKAIHISQPTRSLQPLENTNLCEILYTLFSFIWALLLALDENCIYHHDFLKTINSSLNSCAPGSKGWEELPFVTYEIHFLYPCEIFTHSLPLPAIKRILQCNMLISSLVQISRVIPTAHVYLHRQTIQDMRLNSTKDF